VTHQQPPEDHNKHTSNWYNFWGKAPGDHKGIHYVAVGPTRVGFFSMKRGLFKPSLDRLLVECSRSDVQAVEIKGGMMPAAHFVLRDGTNYALMCPRSSWVSSKRCSSY
jgi:hypothetical protein